MRRIADVELVGETLRLEGSERCLVGPGARLVDCEVVLAGATRRNLQFNGAEFERCRVRTTRPLVNFRGWLSASFLDCEFAGTYRGCDFGNWPDESGKQGLLSNCHFGAAVLDECQFIGVEMSATGLPPWPHFTLLAPANNEAELRGHAWPTRLRPLVDAALMCPPETSGLVLNAGAVAAAWDVAESVLRASLSELSVRCCRIDD